ncbi:MAG: MFS transporter [Myxococcales bacterium]|nr:MFS transporter [Myxococcales bacterium]
MSEVDSTSAAVVLLRPNVRRWVLARLAAGTGSTMMRAVFLWHLYDLSRSTAVLALVGLLSFAPLPVASLLGGLIADAYDRRRLVLVAQTVGLACALALVLLSRSGMTTVAGMLAIIVTNATAAALEAPARQSMLPTLVPKEELSRAVTVMGTAGALAFMSGPALAGLVLGRAGVAVGYAVAAGLYVASMLLVAGVTGGMGTASKRAVSIAGLKEGLAFVRKQRIVLAAMSIDLFAVIFGGATALLPVYANEILGVGGTGYGILASSFEIGALATSLLLVTLPPIRRLGRAILVSVVVYGVATVAFGLSRSFPLSLLAYAVAGMADQVSVVGRTTLVQLETPDELRGRVSSVNMIFIGASNQLSTAEAGFVAYLTTPTFSVVSGGAMVLVVAGVTALLVPALWRFRT